MRDERAVPTPPPFNLEAHRRAHAIGIPGAPTNSTLIFDTIDGHDRHRIRAYIRSDEMAHAKTYVGNLQISKDGGTTPLTPYRRHEVKAKDDDANTTVEIPMGLVRKGWKVRYRERVIVADLRGMWGPGTSTVEADALKGWSAWFDPDDTEQPPPVTTLTLDVDEHRAQITYLIPDDPLNADADDPRVAHEWIELWKDALDSGTLIARDRHHKGERWHCKISKPHNDTFYARVYTVSPTGVKSTAATTSATKNTPSQPAAPTVVFQGARNRAVKVTPATVSPTDADIDTHIIEVVTMATHTTPSNSDDGDMKRVDADPTTGAPERSARFTKLPGGEWVYCRTRVKDTQRRRSAFSPWTDAGQAGADDDTPTGVVRKWSGALASMPPGYLHCNGAAVSRTTYADLDAVYAAASYPYGSGDGSTTFNVPDIKHRAVFGAGSAYVLGATEGDVEASRNVGEHAIHKVHGHHHEHTGHKHGTHDHTGHHHGTHGHHGHKHGSHAHDAHAGGGSVDTGSGSHTHGKGTLATNAGAHQDNISAQGTNKLATDTHTHAMSGDTGSAGSSHSHTVSGSMTVCGAESGTTSHKVDTPSVEATHDDQGNTYQANSDPQGDTVPGTTDYKYGGPTLTDGSGTALTIDSADADSNKGHKRHGRIHLHFMVKT